MAATAKRRVEPPTPGRKRRWAGWGLLALGVLITGLWLVSGWWWLGYSHNSTQVILARGTVFVYQRDSVDPTAPQGWNAAWLGAEWEWTVTRTFDDLGPAYLPQPNCRLVDARIAGYIRIPGYWGVLATLWPLCLFFLCSGTVLLWSARCARRRAMIGVCTKCGYSLAGLAAEGPCPECGQARATA